MKLKAALITPLLVFIGLPTPSLAQEQSIFKDASAEAGISFSHVASRTATRGMGMNSGAAWFDYDNDGDLDLYVTQGFGDNAFFQNNGDGTFIDVAEEVNALNSFNIGAGVAIADYDNDGWDDMYLANADRDVLLRNDNGERFIDVTADVGIFDNDLDRGMSAAWGDFNNDGYLDIYVTNHFNLFNQEDIHQDRLYMNNQGESFTDVSEWLGIEALNGYGFIGTWTDYDEDGDLDIFVINDCGFSEIYHTSKLFRNDGPSLSGDWRFTDVSERAGADHCQNGMGIAVGDYDRDGSPEYFYTNIGEKMLLLHYDTGSFYDTAEDSGVYTYHPEGRNLWTWGANFFDYDLDGWLDLYVAAGALWLSSSIEDNPQPNVLFKNNKDGTFEDVSAISGVDDPRRSRSPVYGDYDGDGDIDLFVVNSGQDAFLYENTIETSNNYLIIDLEGSISNRDGIGAKLKLTTPEGSVQFWETRSGSSLGGGDDRAAYFGLGSESVASSLEITWPSGIKQSLENIEANQRMLVKEVLSNTSTEHEPIASALSLSAFPNPFQDELFLDIQSSGTSHLNIEIYDILGRVVASQPGLPIATHTTRIALSTLTQTALPAGMYIVQAAMQDGVRVQQLVIKQ